MRIISRAEWGARPPKTDPVYVPPSKRVYFVGHHSGAPVTQTVRAIQDWCMDGRGFNDIDYNFLVRGSTGEIYEGRGWDIQGAHTVGFNTTGAGVCIIGIDQCSDAAKLAVRWLYEQYNQRCGKTLLIRGHRDLDPPRDCPGDHNEAWLKAGLPAPEVDGDDMDQATFNTLMNGYAELVSGFDGASDAQKRLKRLWGQVAGADTVLAALQARADETVDRLTSAVMAQVPAGSLTADQVQAAVTAGVREVLLTGVGTA